MKIVIIASTVLATLAGCSDNIRSLDQHYVDKAIYVHSNGGKTSKGEVLKKYRPAVVYLPEMVCVGLNLKRGIAGGDSTYCFDKRSQKLVVEYLNGE